MGKMTEKEMSHILKKGSWVVSMNFLKVKLMICSLHLKVESLFFSGRGYVKEKIKIKKLLVILTCLSLMVR